MSVRLLFAVLGLSIALPSSASAQEHDALADAPRITLFTGGAFGGKVSVTWPNLPFTSRQTLTYDLDATPIVGARFEVPVHRFIVLGGQFRTAFWRSQGSGPRSPLLDFDVTAKVRYAFRVGSVVLEPYALMPFGFTLNVWDRQDLPMSSDKTIPGWNIGGFAGLTVLTKSRIGVMIELGVMHHAAYDNRNTAASYSLTLTQFTLQAGPTYAF